MPVTRTIFGRLEDGRAVGSLLLQDTRSGFSVEVIEYGATLRAIKVPSDGGRIIDTILSYPNLADYEAGNAYLGAVVGRCAGRTMIDERTTLPLTCNEESVHLHGGTTGLSHSLWQTVAIDDGRNPMVRMRHRSPRGEDGYPGDLVVEAEFALVAPLALSIVLKARSDVDTPVNLTLHPYFNLSGNPAKFVDDHELRIDAEFILPIDPMRIPTGETMAVAGTPFDFRTARTMGARRRDDHPQLSIGGGYDHYYVLNEGIPAAADVYCPSSALALRIHTNQRGLQFYSGGQLERTTPAAFKTRSGFCLEPHAFPNAINQSRFPGIVLQAHETYRHETSYAFHVRSQQQ